MSVNIKENGQLVKTAGLNSQTVIIDNLTTQDATKALSANQGYVLNQNKVDKVTGKGLSTNDYTNEDKAKVTSSNAKITNYEDRGYLGKNLLKVTARSTTTNGLTFTVNNDGSIKISGTATANTYFYPFGRGVPSNVIGNNVIVNGSTTGVAIRIYHYDGTNTVQSENGNDSPTVTISTAECTVDIRVASGTTVNTTIYPMLRLATGSTTFVPYVKSNIELDNKITHYENMGYLEKNLLNPDNIGHYGRDTSTGQIDRTENSLSSTTDLVKVSPSTKYTISRNGTSYGSRVFYYNSNKEYINNTVDYNKSVFTTPNNCYYVAFQSGYVSGALDLWCMVEGESTTYIPYAKSNIELDSAKIDKTASEIQTSDGQFTTVTGGLMQSCVVDLEPIQSGSGTPSPTNVRPISGHTQVQVGNCGKNKFPYPYLFSSTTRTDMTITAQSDGKIVVTGTSTSSVVERIDVQYVTLDVGSYIISGLFPKTGCYATLRDGDTGAWIANIETNSYALNVASKKKYLIAINITSGNTTGVTYEPMIRKASDSADFEPYNGYTTTINLGGTRYGGTLDAVSGVLTVTHGIIGANDFDTYASGTSGGGLHYVQKDSTGSKLNGNGICNMMAVDNQNAWTSTIPVAQISPSESTIGRIRVYCSSTSLSNFKSEYAGLLICYELATPQTIQLTPTQLETLVGKNDVFAPLVGQTVEEVEFREVLAYSDIELNGGLTLGETSSTAYRGDRGKTAYDHSQSTHARTDATAVAASSTNGNIKINGTETTVYTHPGSGTNPHGTTKSDVGLGNVGNFKAVSTVASQGLSDTEKSNARDNIGAGTSSLTIGSTASTAAAGNHTHSTSIAADSGTNQLTLAANTKYKLTAGGTGFVFTTPPDTTYSSKTAASGGTDVSLVTTGEKYTWDNKLAMNTSDGIKTVNGGGTNWWFKICTINITTAYINRPILFELSQRGYMLTHLQLMFSNVNTTDPALVEFISDYETEYYIRKTATSTWEVYGKYSEQWGLCTLHRIGGAGANIGITVNMENAGTSTPSDLIRCTGGKQRSIFAYKYQKVSTNSKWYQLFTINYTSYNYASLRFIVKCGYYGLYECYAGIRFTPNGLNADETWLKTITCINGYKTNVKLYQVDTNRIGIAAYCVGQSSDMGFEIIDITSEANAITSSSISIPNPFTELSAEPTTFGKLIYLTGSYNDLLDKPTIPAGTVTKVSTGTGLTGGDITSTGTISTYLARVAKDSKVFPGKNKIIWEEYTSGANYNLPTDAWYHIISMQGADTNYGTQLALGMTATGAYYRNYNNGTWSNWNGLINTWRGVQDNLTSTATNQSLSANQGRLLANGSARDSTKVAKAGDTMTGDLTIAREGTTANNYPSMIYFKPKDTTTGQQYAYSYLAAYNDHGASTAGTNMVLQSGGGMFFGSGESPGSHYSAKGASYTGEDTFLTSDGTTHLQSNGNTIANRVGFQINTSGYLIPEKADAATNGIGGLGNSSYRVKDIYSRSFNELITGSGTAAQDKGSGVSPRYFPAKWTFNIGRAPVDGDIITIKIPVAGHDYGVFVSINNGTNYHPVRVDYGTGRLTTHYGNGQYITLIYTPNETVNSIFAVNGADARSNIKGCWTVLNYRDSNHIPSAYCDTAATTAAKGASCTGYTATANSYIHVIVVNTNTSASALTLNINGQGAKPIYINGSASSSSNYNLVRGSYLVYYNGTNYYFRTDGKLTGAGMVDIGGNTGKFLRGDGTWQTPANNAVTQTDTTTNASYRVLFSSTADDTTRTEGARKSGDLTYNPYLGVLQTPELSVFDGATRNYYYNLNSSGVDFHYSISKGDIIAGTSHDGYNTSIISPSDTVIAGAGGYDAVNGGNFTILPNINTSGVPTTYFQLADGGLYFVNIRVFSSSTTGVLLGSYNRMVTANHLVDASPKVVAFGDSDSSFSNYMIFGGTNGSRILFGTKNNSSMKGVYVSFIRLN